MKNKDIIRQEELDFIKEIKTKRVKEVRGEFKVHGKDVFYSTMSMWLLDSSNFLRKSIVWLIEWR
jgi:hypothetical protein